MGASLIDVQSPDYDIRYMSAEDVPLLKEWMLDAASLPYLPTADEKEVEMAVNMWQSYSQYNCVLAATWKGKPCGMGVLFLMPYRKVAHRGLAQLIVDPKFRRQGVGASLIKNIKHLAKDYFNLEWVVFEVVEGSPVIALLERAEFKEYVRQENYFKREDGARARLLFECDLRDGA